MATHVVPITNGAGSKSLANGTYAVTASTKGYDNATIDPASLEITDGVNEYDLTIGATGVLTLHVSDDGTDAGVPIEGAQFNRCDSEGNVYGDAVTSDGDGNAVFSHVPYSEEDTPPTVYYKQIASDGEHEFDDSLKTEILNESTKLVEVQNAESTERAFTLKDANYSGLPIEDGEFTLTL